MKVSENDRKELIDIGIFNIPDEIPRAAVIEKNNFDREKFDFHISEQSAWYKKNFDLFRYNGYDWPQDVAIFTFLDDFIVLAISTNFVAGEDSDSFVGYFILTRKEYDDIKVQLFNLIKDKTNGLHHNLYEIINQRYTGDKLYRNYFSGINVVDCQDDGEIKFITPKRKLPKQLRRSLEDFLRYINWDESEYRCDAFTGSEYTGIMEIVLLKNIFSGDRTSEILKIVNDAITEMN